MRWKIQIPSLSFSSLFLSSSTAKTTGRILSVSMYVLWRDVKFRRPRKTVGFFGCCFIQKSHGCAVCGLLTEQKQATDVTPHRREDGTRGLTSLIRDNVSRLRRHSNKKKRESTITVLSDISDDANIMRRTTLRGKKLHPCSICNNLIKLR